MLRKTITYKNLFTDKLVEETHYFHISEADLAEMEIEEVGDRYVDKDNNELTGLRAKITKIQEAEDGRAILAEMKAIMRRAYGVKEGDRFVKTQAAWDRFASSEAFSAMFFELCTDGVKAAEFMSAIIPDNLDQVADRVQRQAAEARRAGLTVVDTPSEPAPAVPTPEPVSDLAPVVVETPEQPPTTPSVSEGMTPERKALLDIASSTNPIKLSPTDMIDGDPDYIRDGIVSGRFTT